MRNFVTKLILYTTDACHLCEQAKTLIFSVIDGTALTLVEVDIAEDEVLLQKFGLHIPVLESADSQQRCYWPFDSEQVFKLVAS